MSVELFKILNILIIHFELVLQGKYAWMMEKWICLLDECYIALFDNAKVDSYCE